MGILLKDVDGFVNDCCNLDFLIKGLMCILLVDEEFSLYFVFFVKIVECNGLKGLLMGMSGDFEKVVSFGVIYVWVGFVIFGVWDYG